MRFPRSTLFSAALVSIGCGSAAGSDTTGDASPPLLGETDGDASPDRDASGPMPGVDASVGTFVGDAAADGGMSACGQLYLVGQDTGAAPDMSQPVVLYAFDPSKPSVTRVGAIACMTAAEEFPLTPAQCSAPTGGGCSAAMAVGQDGIAWIFTPYGQGTQKVYAVRTADATCVGSPMSVSAAGYSVTAAAFVAEPSHDGGSAAHTYAVLEEASSPSGLVTFGEFDPATGAVNDIEATDPAADWATSSQWYLSGNAGSAHVNTWTFPGAWSPTTTATGTALLAIDPFCTDCTNQTLDGGAVPTGTPAWQMGIGPMPPSLLPPQRPWTAVWALYYASASSGAYLQDAYHFSPGWWTGGHREVTQLDLTQVLVTNTAAQNEAAVHSVMTDLGFNAFAATAGPACPPAAQLPPPPPTQ